jgi:hypothetical protein
MNGLRASAVPAIFCRNPVRHVVVTGPGLSVEFEDPVQVPETEACVERLEAAMKKANPDIVTLFVKPQTAGTWKARRQKIETA